jgi:phosphatidylglycerophosphate synthase
MKYSFRDVCASLPREKFLAESFWSRFVLRPLSFPAAWLALACGMSPNMMSWLSALCALAGGALLGWAGGAGQWAGVALLFVFSVLDCADGNMARTTKIYNPWGSWTDAVGGYIAYTACLLGLGMAAERAGGFGPAGLCVFLGGFSAAANMLLRAAVQFSRLTAQAIARDCGQEARPGEKHENPGREKWISENLGVTGIMSPAIAAGLAFSRIHWVLFFYTLLYGVGSVWVIFKLALKTAVPRKDLR